MAKKGRRRQDHFARRAQAQGFPARSVYKLEAIHGKYEILRPGYRVLDLGAAPGSWSIYCAGHVGAAGLVVAVDLTAFTVDGKPGMAPVEILQGDFTDDRMAARLVEFGPFDLVLSDAAPATTGNRLVDTGRSEGLVESILDRLDLWLHPGGHCICKLFQGGGEQRLLAVLRDHFDAVHAFRPKAVRSESFETYLIGLGWGGNPTEKKERPSPV